MPISRTRFYIYYLVLKCPWPGPLAIANIQEINQAHRLVQVYYIRPNSMTCAKAQSHSAKFHAQEHWWGRSDSIQCPGPDLLAMFMFKDWDQDTSTSYPSSSFYYNFQKFQEITVTVIVVTVTIMPMFKALRSNSMAYHSLALVPEYWNYVTTVTVTSVIITVTTVTVIFLSWGLRPDNE